MLIAHDMHSVVATCSFIEFIIIVISIIWFPLRFYLNSKSIKRSYACAVHTLRLCIGSLLGLLHTVFMPCVKLLRLIKMLKIMKIRCCFFLLRCISYFFILYSGNLKATVSTASE